MASAKIKFKFCPECGNPVRIIPTAWPEYSEPVHCESCGSKYSWSNTDIVKIKEK